MPTKAEILLTSISTKLDAMEASNKKIGADIEALSKTFGALLCAMAARLQSLDTASAAIQTTLNSLVRRGVMSEKREIDTMATVAEILTKVEAQGTVIGSATTLLGELKDMLDAAIVANDPVALQEVSDLLGAQTAALSAAVVANTPAAP